MTTTWPHTRQHYGSPANIATGQSRTIEGDTQSYAVQFNVVIITTIREPPMTIIPRSQLIKITERGVPSIEAINKIMPHRSAYSESVSNQ